MLQLIHKICGNKVQQTLQATTQWKEEYIGELQRSGRGVSENREKYGVKDMGDSRQKKKHKAKRRRRRKS